MENTSEKIGELLKEKGMEFKSSSSTVYRFFAFFAQDARLKGCDVQILSENGTIRICTELPIRIRRDEGAAVSSVIARMNETMPENAGYILDPIKGTVQLAARYDMPDNVEELEKMLDWAAQNMDGIATLLMNTVHVVEKKDDAFRDPWSSVDDEEAKETDDFKYERYSPYEDWKYTHPRKKPFSKLSRFMSKLWDKNGIA